MSTENQFKEANPTHSELLRYHLRVTNRVDDEVALRDAKKKVTLLSDPPIHKPHQNAQISHDEQKTVININNKEAEKLAKKQQAAIANDNKSLKAKISDAVVETDFKIISPEEFEKIKKQAEQQVKNAANRKDDEKQGESKPASATATSAVKPPWEA